MPRQLLEPGTPFEDYFLLDKIGEGASGSVFAGLTADNHQVVLKFIPLTSSWFEREYRREVATLKRFNKVPQTVDLIDSFTSGSYGVIVLQKMDMDLLDYIEQGDITIEDVKCIFRHVCKGIQSMHHKRTAHLDIKPENIFMNDPNTVCLGDFGSSFRWSKENPQKYGVSGTTFYCAPEVKQKNSYQPAEADIWSLGILLHVLLTGFWPYAAKSQEALSDNISKGKIKLLENKLPNDEDIYALLHAMLAIHPADRLTIDQVLNSPFLLGNTTDRASSVFTPRQQAPGISSSCSQPNLAELSLIIDQEPVDVDEPSKEQETLVLSPRGVRLRQKKKKKGKEQKRRTSWSTKHFLAGLSKLVK